MGMIPGSGARGRRAAEGWARGRGDGARTGAGAGRGAGPQAAPGKETGSARSGNGGLRGDGPGPLVAIDGDDDREWGDGQYDKRTSRQLPMPLRSPGVPQARGIERAPPLPTGQYLLMCLMLLFVLAQSLKHISVKEPRVPWARPGALYNANCFIQVVHRSGS